MLLSLAAAGLVACGTGANTDLAATTTQDDALRSDADLLEMASRTLLDKDFKVYTRGNVVINHPAAGFTEKVLPTNNDFTAAPGCYLACYSHNEDTAIYGLGDNIFVMGQVRVPGKYVGRICRPEGQAITADVSAVQSFKDLCNRNFADNCKDGCWAGGDTGGCFGIQSASLLMANPHEDLIARANRTVLSNEFKVFTDGHSVINHPAPGFTEKVLPTDNRFTAAPGCYLACYAHNQDNSVYAVGDDIFVMGQVRVAGGYQGRLCKPQGLDATADVSAEQKFKDLCNNTFADICQDGCWAGGDTGGWFGIR